MSKIFVVLERSYEYNDEGYDASEGGNVIIGFSTEAAAEAKVVEKTVNKFRTGDVDVLQSYDNPFRCSNAAIEVAKKVGVDLHEMDHYDEFEDGVRKFKDLSDEDLKVLADDLRSPMFYVEETELKD